MTETKKAQKCRIEWSKIDIITYSGEYMSDECKKEVAKARERAAYLHYMGNDKAARRIERRLYDLQNYVG